MSVRLSRASASPGGVGEHEAVEVDDAGRATVWRSWSDERAGRFGRTLTHDEQDRLRAAVSAAAAQPVTATGRTWAPDGGTEQLSGDDLPLLELDPYDDGPEGWQDVVALLRTLVDELVADPVAAVEVVVGGAPPQVVLRHVGTEPVTVGLGTVAIEAYLVGRDDEDLAAGSAKVDGPAAPVTAVPGWRHVVPADLGVPAPGHGQHLHVTVEVDLDAHGDGRLRRAHITAVSPVVP